MALSRRKQYAAAALCCGLTLTTLACQPAPSEPSPSPAATISAPAIDLNSPGQIRSIVTQLTQLAGKQPIVRLQIDANQINLTFVDETSRPQTLSWQAGKLARTSEGMDFAVSTSFDPADFRYELVGQMFEKAALLAGNDNRQQLHITEYASGNVLLTVTTNPESTTVFFRPDGSLITPLHFLTADGIQAGLQESVGGSSRVLGIGISTKQLWVDVPGAEMGTIERRMRPSGVPVFKALRNQSTTNKPFDPKLIDPLIVARLLNSLPVDLGRANAQVTLVIQQPEDAPEPRLYFDVGGTRIVTSLTGRRLASGER